MNIIKDNRIIKVMEEHRLKEMKPGNEVLFNQLYKELIPLKKSLARGIDQKRLGVEFSDLLSFFDIKFIHVFNKYVDTYPKDILKGHLINSLQTHKNKILRTSYMNKNSVVLNTDFPEELSDYQNKFIDYPTAQVDEELPIKPVYSKVIRFLKSYLSSEAFNLLELRLSPPAELLRKSKEDGKIPLEELANHLQLEVDSLKRYERELNSGIKAASKALVY